jgi:hypothetical protein
LLQAAIRVYQILMNLVFHRMQVALVEKLQFTTIQHRPRPIPLPETLMRPVLEKLQSTTIQHRLRPILLLDTLMKPILPNTSKVGAYLNAHLRTHRIASHLLRAAKVTTKPLSISQHVPQALLIRWPSSLPHLCLRMTEMAESQVAAMFKARVTGQLGHGIERLTLLLTRRIGWVDPLRSKLLTEATRIVLLDLRVKILHVRLDRENFPVQISRPRIPSCSQTMMG